MQVDTGRIRVLGHGLNRPECVLAHASGLLIASDWSGNGGVALIAPDGRVRRIEVRDPGPGVPRPVRPNGVALEPGGTILMAHLGTDTGAVLRLHPDGRCMCLTERADGAPMPPANFVAIDRGGRIWITVSTRKVPRALDYRADAASGFVAVYAQGTTHIVADGLGYTNECLLSADGRTLWVVETFGRRLTAFTVDGARLSERRTVARFGPGDFPDGLAETADGALVVTSIVSNRLLRVDPGTGAVERLMEDADPDHLAEVERAFGAGEMDRLHLDTVRSRHLGHLSSVAFGGDDLGTLFMGTLLGSGIGTVKSGLVGRALPHWNADLGPLAAHLSAAA